MPPIKKRAGKRLQKKKKIRRKKTIKLVSFPSFFRFVNLREILRESKHESPLVEHLRSRQVLHFLEFEIKFNSLKDSVRARFLKTELPSIKIKFKELEGLIVKIKKFESLNNKLKAKGTPRNVIYRRLSRIIAFEDVGILIDEAVKERLKIIREIERLRKKSIYWRK